MLSSVLFGALHGDLWLPGTIAGMAFALALGWLCVITGRGWGAPVAAALAMVWPYVSWYSMESRGYALMMLFCVLFVLAARWLLARPEISKDSRRAMSTLAYLYGPPAAGKLTIAERLAELTGSGSSITTSR